MSVLTHAMKSLKMNVSAVNINKGTLILRVRKKTSIVNNGPADARRKQGRRNIGEHVLL